MIIPRCTALAVLSLALAMGCGDDDSGGNEQGGNNSGGGAGGGNQGSAGNSGRGGMTIEEALATCGNDQTGDLSSCETYDDYIACVETMCDPEECVMDPACDSFVDCFNQADDPCMHGCTPSADCQTCFLNIGTCATSNCLELILSCVGGGAGGMTTPGGACDQLEECCAAQPMQSQQLCMAAAAGARAAGGDSICQQAMSAFCM